MPAKPEYIDEVVQTMERAAELNWVTPGREGNVVELSTELADELMITADVHGHRNNYTKIQRTADLARNPRRHLLMQEVCHGGATNPANGGCMSFTMLEDVARLKTKFPERFHFILSNHEWAEMIDYPILKGRKMLNLMFRLGMADTYGKAVDRVREAYHSFIRSCPIAVRLPNGVFVCHSAPEGVDRKPWDTTLLSRSIEAADLREHGDLFWMLWGRDHRTENAQAFAKMVKAKILIHGHEPCPEGFDAPNDTQLILDCCSDKACYVVLPVGEPLTHAQVVERVKRL